MSIVDYIKLILSIIWYIPKALLYWVLKIITWIVAPVIALPPFVRFEIETDVTGYPSQFPDKKRAFLIPLLMGFQTHDDCLDAFWYSGRAQRDTWMRRYTQEDFDNKGWLRYINYVIWLWRNPAYQFGDWMGWYNKGVQVIKSKDNDHLWKSGQTNVSYYIVKNDKGGVSFQIQGQWHYFKKFNIEYRFGYGWKRFEPDDRCMIDARFIPWRRYG